MARPRGWRVETPATHGPSLSGKVLELGYLKLGGTSARAPPPPPNLPLLSALSSAPFLRQVRWAVSSVARIEARSSERASTTGIEHANAPAYLTNWCNIKYRLFFSRQLVLYDVPIAAVKGRHTRHTSPFSPPLSFSIFFFLSPPFHLIRISMHDLTPF